MLILRLQQREKELQKNKENLNLILDSISESIIVTDLRGRITLMNPVAEGLTGWKLEKAQDKPLGLVFKIFNAKSKKPCENPVEKVLESSVAQGLSNHTTLIAKDSARSRITGSASPIFNTHGKLNGVVLVFRDITEKYQQEETLLDNKNFLAKSQDITYRCSWQHDLTTNQFFWSGEVYQIFGRQPQELESTYQQMLKAIHPEDREKFDSAYRNSIIEGQDQYEMEHRIVKKNSGEIRYVYQKWKLSKNSSGRVIRSIGMVHDITRLKKVEQLLYDAYDKLDKLIDLYADGIVVVNKEKDKIVFINPAGADMLGRTQQELVGRPFGHPFTSGKTTEIELLIKDNIRVLEIRVTETRWEGKPSFLLSLRDITQRKKDEEKLRYLSFHDYLTGLYNRTFFEEEMNRLQNRPFCPIGIIICDLDGLKFINDTLGHERGDELIINTAHLLRKTFRASDIIARVGGDEFAILVTGADEEMMQSLVSRLRKYADQYAQKEEDPYLSLSIGYALSNQIPTDTHALFREADNKMYRQKFQREQSTRNYIVRALMKTLKARDFITEGHSDRLQQLVVSLARSLQLSEETINDLRLLAQFHDLGKVGIPDNILFKPGPLTEKETMEMRTHSEIGRRIALAVPNLEPIAELVLKHHEWWNGQGYPLGLSGEDIPLPCRILAIADAYDAMTQDRPYRRAMPHKEAVKELKRNAGSQFDPDLVKTFIDKVYINPGQLVETSVKKATISR